jgi:hypothetical protein
MKNKIQEYLSYPSNLFTLSSVFENLLILDSKTYELSYSFQFFVNSLSKFFAWIASVYLFIIYSKPFSISCSFFFIF